MATFIPWGRRLGYAASPGLTRLTGASVEIISVKPAGSKHQDLAKLARNGHRPQEDYTMQQWQVRLRINGWPETRYLLAKSEVDVMRLVHAAIEERLEKQTIPTEDIFRGTDKEQQDE